MSARTLIVVVALLALAACLPTKNKQTLLEDTLTSYAAVLRWGNIEEALAFVDPETAKAHPPSALDLERYQQVRITAYTEQPPVHVSDSEVRQVVEIGLVNNNTQAARAVIDRQLWRYDEKTKRWWLTTGLPDITAH